MSDDTTKDWIADMARRHYNPPPPTPRDEIWEGIRERLDRNPDRGDDRRVVPLRRRGVSPWWFGLAATAVLAVGVGIGRWSSPEALVPVADRTADAGADAGAERDDAGTLGRMVAAPHLEKVGPVLALVRADAARGSVDVEVGEWARELLGETRFLLDSGLEMDPELRSVLEDLELVLLQTALVGKGTLPAERGRAELDLLTEDMDDQNLMSRIQAVLPTAGTGFTTS